MTIDHPCYECGAPLCARLHKERTKVGRYTVDDSSQRPLVCANGHAELDLEQLAEYQRRAAVVVLAEAEAIGGAEIKAARKALGLNQTCLGTLLDVRQETVSRWETDQETFHRTARLALLAIVRDPAAIERLDNAPAHADETLHVHVVAA